MLFEPKTPVSQNIMVILLKQTILVYLVDLKAYLQQMSRTEERLSFEECHDPTSTADHKG